MVKLNKIPGFFQKIYTRQNARFSLKNDATRFCRASDILHPIIFRSREGGNSVARWSARALSQFARWPLIHKGAVTAGQQWRPMWALLVEDECKSMHQAPTWCRSTEIAIQSSSCTKHLYPVQCLFCYPALQFIHASTRTIFATWWRVKMCKIGDARKECTWETVPHSRVSYTRKTKGFTLQ